MIKRIVVTTLLSAGVLSGCIAVPVDDGRGYNSGYNHNQNPNHNQYRDRDRDGDGVRNSQDRRPDDPRRY